MIQGIIFDLDGLLADTEPMHFRAYLETFANYGIQLTQEKYIDHWVRNGRGIAEFFFGMGTDIEPGIIDILRKAKRDRYHTILRENPKQMPGVDVALPALIQQYPVSVVSSSGRSDVELTLEVTGLRRYFDMIVSANEVSKTKPDPEGFLLASTLLGIPPENMLVLEDAQKGITAAHMAGMKSIAIPTDYTRNDDFSLATRVVKGMQEVTPELIRTL